MGGCEKSTHDLELLQFNCARGQSCLTRKNTSKNHVSHYQEFFDSTFHNATLSPRSGPPGRGRCDTPHRYHSKSTLGDRHRHGMLLWCGGIDRWMTLTGALRPRSGVPIRSGAVADRSRGAYVRYRRPPSALQLKSPPESATH